MLKKASMLTPEYLPCKTALRYLHEELQAVRMRFEKCNSNVVYSLQLLCRRKERDDNFTLQWHQVPSHIQSITFYIDKHVHFVASQQEGPRFDPQRRPGPGPRPLPVLLIVLLQGTTALSEVERSDDRVNAFLSHDSAACQSRPAPSWRRHFPASL